VRRTFQRRVPVFLLASRRATRARLADSEYPPAPADSTSAGLGLRPCRGLGDDGERQDLDRSADIRLPRTPGSRPAAFQAKFEKAWTGPNNLPTPVLPLSSWVWALIRSPKPIRKRGENPLSYEIIEKPFWEPQEQTHPGRPKTATRRPRGEAALRFAGPSLISTNPTPSSRRAARSGLAQHQRIDALRHTADGHDGDRLHRRGIDHGH
jgi:hypothetical protein